MPPRPPAEIHRPGHSRGARAIIVGLCAGLLALGWLLGPPGASAQGTAGSGLRVIAAVPESFPPEYSLDDSGRPQGFAIDMMNSIATVAGLEVEYRVYPGWLETMAAVERGEADLIPLIGIIPQRNALLQFTLPLETLAISLFVRESTQDVRTLDDLHGRIVAAVETNAAVTLLQGRSGLGLRVLPSIDEALLRLLAGEVDAIAYPRRALEHLARRSNLDGQVKSVGPALLEVKRAIAVRPGLDALSDRLDTAIPLFVGSPEHRDVVNRWNAKPRSSWTGRRLAATLGVVTLVVGLFVFGGWFASVRRLNRELTEQIRERDLAIAQRQRFQDEMIRGEARYRALVENPLQAIVVHRDGKPLFANQAFVELLGYRDVAEVISANSYTDRIHPEDLHILLGYRAAVDRGDHPPERITYRVVRPDGATAWVSGASSQVAWEDGVANQVTMVDITPRMRLSAVLEKFFQVSREGLIIADRDGTLLQHNPGFAAILGYPEADLIGRNLSEFIDPEDLAHTQERVNGHPKQDGVGVVLDFENRYRHQDGRSIWIAWNAAIDEDGQAYCSARDVTLQKESEQLLVAERNRVRSIIEQAVDGLLVIDGDGIVQFANPAAKALFQCDLEGQEFGHAAAEGPVEVIIPRGQERRIAEMRGSELTWEGRPARLASLRDVTEQRLADEQLRSLAEAVEQAAESILITDPAGIILYVNPAFEHTTGYSREEALGRTPRLTRSNAHDRDFFAELWRTIRSGEVWSGTITNCCKDGRLVIEDVTISPIMDDAGDIKRYICVRHDVTERRQAEQARQESERMLQAVFDGMPLALVVVEPTNRRIVAANSQVQAVFGYRPDELIGRTTEFLHVDAQHFEEFGARGNPVLDREGTWSTEFRMRRKDGSIVPTENHVTLLRDDAGAWNLAISVVADITARKQAEAALAEREERFRAVVDSSVDVITLLDSQGTILLESPSVTTSLGYTPQEMEGRPVVEFVHEEDLDMVLAALQKAAAEPGVTQQVQVRMRHRHGGWRVMEARGRLASAIDGGHFVVNTRDVTEQQRLEEQLRQSQKMEAIGSLAGGIAHDFNNLLSIILSYGELLQEELQEQEQAHRDLQHIVAAGKRAAALTRQLLAFSRRQILRTEVLALDSIVQGIEKMLRRLIGEDVELEVCTAEGDHRVRADAGQLEQIVMNLAVNARDAMPMGGRLTIQIEDVILDGVYTEQHAEVTPGPYVMLSVSDTGVGMEPEVRKQIFEPFFTTKEQGKGTGLGLSMVYGIVKQSGGSIWVYSEPGRGSTFKIYLPQVSEELTAKALEAIATSDLAGSETILVAEDEESVRSAACRILREHGYTVLEACDGQEALQCAERSETVIDLLLTDVVMPKMSGRDLTMRLKDLRPELRSLYMSGYTDDAIVRHGALDARSAFLQKPFSRLSLLETVRKVLDAPGAG